MRLRLERKSKPERGEAGLIGPEGPRGPQGERGVDGQRGPIGEQGLAGKDGDYGGDGWVQDAPALSRGGFGLRGMNMTAKEMAQEVYKAIRGHVSRSLKPLADRVKALEDSAPKVRDLTPEERDALIASLMPHMKAHHAEWAIGFERSANELMLKAVSNIPEPEPGRDGVSVEEFSVEHDGERTFKFILDNDRVKYEKAIKVPMVLDRGVYQAGKAYEQGDGVSWGGSFWICQKDTQEKPGTADWRLAVKKGRDGKNV